MSRGDAQLSLFAPAEPESKSVRPKPAPIRQPKLMAAGRIRSGSPHGSDLESDSDHLNGGG